MQRKALLGVLLSVMTISLPAQNVTYGYDNAGNRTSRVITFSASLRSSEAITALDDIVAQQVIKIYPNPTRGQLAVEITNFNADIPASLVLSDLSGKIIDRKQTVSGYETFNLQGHPNGVYLLRVSINEETVTWKIIKE